MIWKETGVNKGSYMCFFNPPSSFKAFYYYMVSCGYFLCNESYEVRNDGNRPPSILYPFTLSCTFRANIPGPVQMTLFY